jgi:hypothetical protein
MVMTRKHYNSTSSHQKSTEDVFRCSQIDHTLRHNLRYVRHDDL